MDKQADLRKWFKEKWVDISRKKKGGGHPECGRDDADDGGGYPKCRPQRAAARMSKKQKTYAVRAKRSKPQGVGGKPTMVATFKKKAMFNPEVDNILENLEKEALFGLGRNSRGAMKARARARKRKSLDATKAMRRNARVMGATARAEAAGRSFTNKTKPMGYKSDYMKKKHAPTFMGSAKKVLKTPGGAAIGAGLAGAAIGAATAKPKTVTTTAPDGTKTTTTTKPNRLGRALAAGAGAGLAAGGARLAMKKMASAESNNILSLLEKEARAKKPQVLPKAGWNMVAPVFRGDSIRRERKNMIRKAGIGAGIGAAAGAVRGAVKDPGTNEDGTKKSRLKAIARNAAGGAAIGGAAGAGVSAANDRGYSIGLKSKS